MLRIMGSGDGGDGGGMVGVLIKLVVVKMTERLWWWGLGEW